MTAAPITVIGLGPMGQAMVRTLVNLSSDTPERTREAAGWADEHDAVYLTGGVMVPAPMIGTDSAYVYYSGPPDALERHRSTLARIGTPRYLGEDPARAQLMYQAALSVFLTTLSSLLHGTALLESTGLTAGDVFSDLLEMVSAVPPILTAGDNPSEQIDSGRHPGELSTATLMGATADHIVAASESAGVDVALPRAVQAHYSRAIDAGNGGDNWTRIIDGIRNPQ